MKKIFLSILVVSGLFSCEDSLEDTFDELDVIEANDDDRAGSNTEYTISDDDYEAIVPTNNQDFYHENSAFLSEADAAEKIPVILLDRFGGMQNDEFIVNYETVSDEFVETVAALDSLNTISTSILEGTYTLQEEDYPNEGLAFYQIWTNQKLKNL